MILKQHNHHGASAGGISLFQNRRGKAPPAPAPTNDTAMMKHKSIQESQVDHSLKQSEFGNIPTLSHGLGGFPSLQKTDVKNTIETTTSKDSLQEPSQGAITQIPHKSKTSSGMDVDATSSFGVAGGGGNHGAFLHARKSASSLDGKLGTSNTFAPPSPKGKTSVVSQSLYKEGNTFEQPQAASYFQGGVLANHTKTPTAQPAGNKTVMHLSPTERSVGKSLQASGTESSTVAPMKAPRTDHYSPLSPSFVVESVSNRHGTFEHELTPLSTNRSKMAMSDVNQPSDQEQVPPEQAGDGLILADKEQNGVEVSHEYNTPRPFSNQIIRTEADVLRVDENFKANGFEIETPSFEDSTGKIYAISAAWDHKNPVFQANTSVTKPALSMDISLPPTSPCLSDENHSTEGKSLSNIVTPGSHLNQMDSGDDMNEGGDLLPEAQIDWESIQGEFKQKMQSCGDIVQAFGSDMLDAMETLEVVHADLQIMECDVLDQISKLEELETSMDNLIESYKF